MPEEEARPHWTLDRRIPLALVLALALQSAGLVAWGVQLSERVEVLERTVAEIAKAGTPGMRERVIKLEEQRAIDHELLVEIRNELREMRREQRRGR
jgi:hypothetical protein